MKLILIRHGKTAANEKHLYCGASDLPLSGGGAAPRWRTAEGRQTIRIPPGCGYSPAA